MIETPEGSPPPPVDPGPPRDLLLQARDIWFSYDRRTPVLRGVSLGVDRGQVVMVLGRSGSGKTTLLKVLKGLLRPQRGDVVSPAGVGLRPADIAYIPQTLGLVRNMTALENVLMGALARTGFVRSLVRSFPREFANEACGHLAGLGLAEKTEQPVFNLSGGERQRVAIARALMQRPALILADEFVSQLDYHTGEEILAMMRAVAESGVGIVTTTHEVHVAIKHAAEIVVMRRGEIVHRAAPDSMPEPALLDLLK